MRTPRRSFLPGASDAVRVSVWALMCLLMTDSATDLQLDPELIASILRSARVEVRAQGRGRRHPTLAHREAAPLSQLRSPCERAHTQVLYLLTFMVMEHGPALTHLAGDAALLRTLPDALVREARRRAPSLPNADRPAAPARKRCAQAVSSTVVGHQHDERAGVAARAHRCRRGVAAGSKGAEGVGR